MVCSTLNLLYQLDISLVKICFIYTLKVGGHLSVSTHSPWLQFVTGLPDSPKTKAKGVVLVEGPWYGMPGSLGLPFDLNQTLLFPVLFQLDGACTSLGGLCFDMPLLIELFAGRHKLGRLVSWVENTRLDRIRRQLEINKREHNHELISSTKKLAGVGRQSFFLHSSYHPPSVARRAY